MTLNNVAFSKNQRRRELEAEKEQKVRYEGDTGHFDGLTYGHVYVVISENEHQYAVNNDLGSTSTIQKNKFSH